jgi:hypothetical protein
MSLRKGLLAAARAALAMALIGIGLTSVTWGGKKDVVAVGGIYIDTDGLLRGATIDESGAVADNRRRAAQEVEANVNSLVGMRMVSLRRLQAAIAERQRVTAPLTDEMKYLAGLQRVQYVFVYPEQNDIVLAGPGEGWKVDDRGFVIGLTTGRPVLLLDDLLVALRTAEAAAQGALSCSIDPTQEGLQRLQNYVAGIDQMGPDVIEGIEQNLGLQAITVRGVPVTSHFARVMVAADYRMKRLAMAFDKPPVREMPSYLQLVTARASKNIMPRWWLSTNYDALLRDPEGLAWELRGPGVKALTEDEFVAAGGERTRTGEASPAAQQWADTMTERYEELSVKDPIFGQLRNVMDLAVISALIVKENLADRAGLDLALLMDPRQIEIDSFSAPVHVASRASALKKGRGWVISASGGVEIQSWEVADNVEASPDMANTRDQAAPREPSTWWWNG